MPVVPFDPRTPKSPLSRPPPSEPFALMAAAQMHAEGRLVEPDSKAPDLYETRPQASMGGRSPVEANNPELGPSQVELNARMRDFELAHKQRVK